MARLDGGFEPWNPWNPWEKSMVISMGIGDIS